MNFKKWWETFVRDFKDNKRTYVINIIAFIVLYGILQLILGFSIFLGWPHYFPESIARLIVRIGLFIVPQGFISFIVASVLIGSVGGLLITWGYHYFIKIK